MKFDAISLPAFDGVTRVNCSANKSCTAVCCSLRKFMLSVEGTAGNVVLEALQNVIENVRRNHYRIGDCPDLSVTLDSFKTCNMCERWRAAPAQQHSRGTRPSDSHICSSYIYFKYKGMITSVRCFIWLTLILRRREDKTQDLLCGLDLETRCRDFKETDRQDTQIFTLFCWICT